MEKEILVNRFFRLSKCFMGFLLSAFLILSPVYAGSGSKDDNIDKMIERIKMHFQIELNDPGLETAEKWGQLEGKLRSGEISTTKCCTQCHADQRGNQ